MSTEQVVEKVGKGGEAMTEKSTAAIRAAASAVVESINDGIELELHDKLDHLRETLAEGRRNGMSEERIQGILDCVRASCPDVTDTWAVILEEIWVYVWLEDPDGNRVRGDTAIVDRVIWEELDGAEVLEAEIQRLQDGLEVNWEVVEPGKTQGARPEKVES